MMSKTLRFAVAGLALLGLAIAANAASIQLKDAATGADSGWRASWDSSLDSVLSLSVDSVSSDQVVVEKKATFTADRVDPSGFVDPLVIVFQQTLRAAKPLVIVTDETVVNETGIAWGGFKFTILDGSTGTDADTQFDPAATNIGNPGGFKISPFTTHSFLNNGPAVNGILLVGGGTVPAVGDNVWRPGQGADAGELVIKAAPTASGAFKTFTLKEQPILIPLPAAAWTGLAGLIGLGLLSSAKSLRRFVA